MSERLPYEDQLKKQWNEIPEGNDLPIPDEDMAWPDMKRRLEEDEDRKPFFFWLRGCAGWGIVGLLFLGLSWFILRPEKWFETKTTKQETQRQELKGGPKQENKTGSEVAKGRVNVNNNSIDLPPQVVSKEKEPGTSTLEKDKVNKPVDKADNRNQDKDPVVRIIERKKPVTSNKQPKSNLNKEKNENDKTKGPVTVGDVKGKAVVTDTKPILPEDTNVVVSMAPDTVAASQVTAKTNSVTSIRDSVTMENKPRQDSSEINKWVISTGIGVFQQLPVAGQKLTPYNSLGGKGSLADYIPSLYARFGKENKWFIQGEFRYGAPQQTKEFVYRQGIVPDTGSNPVFSTVTSYSLKKTFYHQLPVTFHNYIMPGWTVGAGVQWNRFNAAIGERTTARRNNFTQNDSVVTKLIRADSDTASEFTKSFFQGIIETQYQYKRFSFGARYSFGLEPYIRFTLPGQPLREEKNSSLQIFLRFQLWRSKMD